MTFQIHGGLVKVSGGVPQLVGGTVLPGRRLVEVGVGVPQLDPSTNG